MLVHRHNLMTAASFEPVTPIVLVAQKILQRAEQKCTEPAFLLICATQRIFFNQMGKKTLDVILRFGRSVTPKSQKGVKGWPIRFTEIGKSFSSCFRWIGLSSARNESPVRRLKRRSALLQCSRYRFHNLGSPFVDGVSAHRMPVEFCEPDLRGKKNCGARFAPGANAAEIREFFANSRTCRRDLLWLAVASREGGWSRNWLRSGRPSRGSTRAIMTVSFPRFRLR